MPTMTHYAIGVMGSASGEHDEATILKMVRLGRAIAEPGFVLVTGKCPGLLYAAARSAHSAALGCSRKRAASWCAVQPTRGNLTIAA